MTPVVEANGIAKLFGQLLAVDDLTVAVRGRGGARHPRPQRCGQDDGRAHADDDPGAEPRELLRGGDPAHAPGGDPAADRRASRERGLSRRPDGRGVPHLSRSPLRHPRPAGPASWPARCSTSSGCSSARDRRSRPTAAGCGSGSASRARSSTTPSPCSWTSPRSASIRPGQRQVLRSVRTIARERGAAVLLSTHLLNEVEENCSHVLILNRGRVISEGTVSEVVSRAAAPRRVRLQVAPEEVERAAAALAAVPGVERVEPAEGEPGWLRVELAGERPTTTARSASERAASARCSTRPLRCARSRSTARA